MDGKALRKRHPVGQLLLDVFDEQELREIDDARDDTAFKLIDADVKTEYCCPSCGYEWSGNPKPNRSK